MASTDTGALSLASTDEAVDDPDGPDAADVDTELPSCDELGEAHTIAEDMVEIRARAMARRALFKNAVESVKIGRYVLLETIGVGGMGIVYGAYDPDLDRRVALKVLIPGAGPRDPASTQATSRLLREARALARVAHPNVINVHEVGTVDRDVFIAMEFVRGATLRTWCEDGERPWQERVEMFAQAGRGLAAAHAAGLTHRDFKPDNVLVGEDGRARVLDFGLARSFEEVEEAPISPMAQSTTGVGTKLTATGAIAGTPAYMAPEQLLASPVDARTDQFSFCVALYEALEGQRPFAGETLAELRANVLGGTLRESGTPRGVPARIRKAILRGLQALPEERHPSMEALLEQLAVPRGRGRAIAAVSAGVAVASLALGVGAWMTRGDGETRCRDAEAQLAGVWDPGTRARVTAALEGTGKIYADGVARGVAERLDRYAARWTEAWTESCVATWVEGSQSERMLDLRAACLQQRRAELETLTQQLQGDTNDVPVARALQAADGLSSLNRCSDTDALSQAVAPPEDPRVAAEVDALRVELGSLRAHMKLGQFERANGMLDAAVARARTSGYRPVISEYLHARGDLEDLLGKIDEAEQTLLDAAFEAEASHHHLSAARVWTLLVYVQGASRRDTEAGLASSRRAEAAILGLGGDEELRSRLLSNLGSLYNYSNTPDYPRAITAFEEALALRKQLKGPLDPSVATGLNNLAMAKQHAGRTDEAEAHYLEAIEVATASLPAYHPNIARPHNNHANLMFERGEFARAKEGYEQALEIWSASLDPNHPSIADALSNLISMYWSFGEPERSIAAAERALEIRREVFGEQDLRTLDSMSSLAWQYVRSARYEDARTLTRRLTEIARAAGAGYEHHVIWSLGNEGAALIGLGRADEGRALLEQVVQDAQAEPVRERTLRHTVPYMVWLAELQLADADDGAATLATLALADSVVEPSDGPLYGPELAFLRARAMWKRDPSTSTRAELRPLLEKAREGFAARGVSSRARVEALDTWRASLPP